MKKNKILTAIFFLLSFSSVSAESNLENFSHEFFSSVYSELNFSKKAALQLSEKFDLSTDLLGDFLSQTDDLDSFSEMEEFCSLFVDFFDCQDYLRAELKKQKDYTELSFELTSFGQKTQVWADGNLENSFFDLISDLNEIDQIFFGKNSQTFSLLGEGKKFELKKESKSKKSSTSCSDPFLLDEVTDNYTSSTTSSTCKNPLYGGYLCLDDSSSCSDTFCLKTSYKTRKKTLFTDSKDLDCLHCLVQFSLEVLDEDLLAYPLTPRENSIKNPNIPNWPSIFRDFFFPLSVSYQPIPLDSEQIIEPSVDFLDFSLEKAKITNLEDRLISQGKSTNELYETKEEEVAQLKLLRQTLLKNQIKELYLKNKLSQQNELTTRFKEFEDLIENGLLKNVFSLPFSLLKKVQENKCTDLNS